MAAKTREMIYIQVQVTLEYNKGNRAKAVAGAKEMVSAAVNGSYAKCQSYKVTSNGKIRSRSKERQNDNR